MPANGHSSLDPNPVQLCSSTKIAEDVCLTNKQTIIPWSRKSDREGTEMEKIITFGLKSRLSHVFQFDTRGNLK